MADFTDVLMPPATFAFLVESILMQAQVQLGLLRFGSEDDKDQEPNLPLARHSIDLLAVLQEKTRGNLTVEEQRLLENGLTELRFRYVQVSDEQKRAAATAAGPSIVTPSGDAPAPDDGPRIITADGGKGTKTS
jgi:hypothetical protein